MFQFLEKFYEHSRNTLIWFIIYFVLQAVIWIALGILILIYPQTLFLLVSLFFILFAAVNIYFALIFLRYTWKLKQVKDALKIK